MSLAMIVYTKTWEILNNQSNACYINKVPTVFFSLETVYRFRQNTQLFFFKEQWTSKKNVRDSGISNFHASVIVYIILLLFNSRWQACKAYLRKCHKQTRRECESNKHGDILLTFKACGRICYGLIMLTTWPQYGFAEGYNPENPFGAYQSMTVFL